MSNLRNQFLSRLHQRAEIDRSDKDRSTIKAILDSLFPAQYDFVTDRCRKKSALCPRRSGKSFACLAQMTVTALNKPGANIVYLTLTRGQGKKNLWGPLRAFNDAYELGLRFHNTDLIATFPNGSQIAFAGAETLQEIEKLRGQSYDLVIIDECKSFNHEVLRELIEEVVGPALRDRRGTLAMIGTPGNILVGPFYQSTVVGLPSGPKVRPWWNRKAWKGGFTWSFHKWAVKDNTAIRFADGTGLWEECLVEKEQNGWADDDPRWIREYLGEWCPSDDVMVYAYDHERNGYDGQLPEGHDWKYVLGLDIGFEDSTALVVAAYSEHHKKLFHVWDYKRPHLIVPEIAKAVSLAKEKFGEFDGMVADTGGLGKMVIETLSTQYDHHFEPAEKKEKYDHIELVNADLISDLIKVRRGSYLEAEMELLQWENTDKKKEDPSLDNHCCDAFLYLWRYAYHHFSTARVERPRVGSNDYWEQYDDEQFMRRVKAKEEELDLSWLERDLDFDLDPDPEDEWTW